MCVQFGVGVGGVRTIFAVGKMIHILSPPISTSS